MAVTPIETHFIQRCDGPVFIGPGQGVFTCACGHPLIQGYEPARFLGVGIQCGSCGALSTTPGLPAGQAPPFAVVIAEPVAEPRVATLTLPPPTFVIGRAEMDRISAMYQPANPPDNVYRFTPALLDWARAAYAAHAGSDLALPDTNPDEPFDALPNHALAWAIAHLRNRARHDDWTCRETAATAAACCHVAGFLHFVATWSHHPLFAAMFATAADKGFSLHGLAPFAAAHCLTMQRNRITFPPPAGDPGRIESFFLATGPTETVTALPEVFDRFEYPFGQPWTEAALAGAVADRVAAAQGRINLRNHGMLLLSPGVTLAGFDEALILAIRRAVEANGRKNRGLLAMAPIVLRTLPADGPRAIQFGYGFFPVVNRHYRGDTVIR